MSGMFGWAWKNRRSKGSAAADSGLNPGRQKVLFVGGKGGVGKTTTASALAIRLAEFGERCLIVSTDPAHSLGDLWDLPIGDRVTELAPNLHGLEINPDAEVEKYLAEVASNMREFANPALFPEFERQLELARLAPGTVEAAMLQRVGDLMIDDSGYDRVIFDTAPTGHTLRLLALPEIMAAWTDGLLRHRDRSESWNAAIKTLGPRPGVGDDLQFLDPVSEQEDERSRRVRAVLLNRRRRLYQARRVMLDPATTGFILVMIPERLPILESLKAAESLRGSGVPILGLVVNRVLPEEPLGEFLELRREQEADFLSRIEDGFSGVPKVVLSMLPRDVEGIETLRALGARLLPAPPRS